MHQSLARHSASQVAPPQGDPAQPGYLAFVDGLRAISILAVVGFHLGLSGFPGGYVGVDVFFVISGFLIINQIKSELEANRFSILSFYSRRALRILPPNLVVLLVTFALAPFVLPTPTIYLEYLRQAAFSPIMLSNFLFYTRQGYFDFAADDKPLLHTWTLSIEEQFYLLVPVLLIVVFRLGNRRFAGLAVAIAVALGIASLAGAIAFTTTEGRNPAFYFPHWRAWEFIVGGLIGGGVIGAVRRAPPFVSHAIGTIGLACIVAAVVTFDTRTPYPSWRAMVPVAGAGLVILSGLAQPQNVVARFLALRWLVGIGLVSYGWYLWHWPILSFQRILRLGELSLVPDLLGGGVLAFVLACASYRFLELPIRQWRRSHRNFMRPGRIVIAGTAACIAVATIGGLSAFIGYSATASYVASRYDTNGKGVLDNNCGVFTSSDLPESCLDGRLGLLLGDSHANALAGSFTRSFQEQGVKLVAVARGGCNPMLLAPSQRKQNRETRCSNLLGPFERILALPNPVSFVIITSLWPQIDSPELLAELIQQFDSSRTRVLLIGPVPIFRKSSLDCIVLSDRYEADRERCTRPRIELESLRASVVNLLKSIASRYDNVRFIDPLNAFCDSQTCRPFHGNQVYFRDAAHVLPSGAERIYNEFEREFRWLAAPR